MKFLIGCLRESFCANNLMVKVQSMNELLAKLKTWRSEMENKRLPVNMGKKKLMISGSNLGVEKI